MTRPTIYFVRHGQTDWNAEDRLQGQADIPLNDIGREQAAGNGRKLVERASDVISFDFVASPLSRTRETMEILRASMGLDRGGYRKDERLVELHFGDWQGRTYPELEASDPGCSMRRSADKWNFLPPGLKAESYEMLAARIGSWLDEVTRETVCVTHGGVIRSIFRLADAFSGEECASLPIPQDQVLRFQNGALTWL